MSNCRLASQVGVTPLAELRLRAAALGLARRTRNSENINTVVGYVNNVADNWGWE